MKRALPLFFFATIAFSDVGQDVILSGQQQEIMREFPDKFSGNSVAPVVGYEPIYKLVVGGAYFYQSPDFNFGFDANTNFNEVYQGHYHIDHRPTPTIEYGLKGGLTHGYDPYFGEGGETRVSDFQRLWGVQTKHRLYFAGKVTPIASLGFFASARLRTEKPPHIHPDERTLGFGVFTKVDTRINKSDPREGFVWGTAVTWVPTGFSTLDVPGILQLESDIIVYQEVLEQMIPGVVAAFQVTGGYTIGDPTYSFKYRLGGSDSMRGYHENRFRGKKYYLQQTELRVPIWNPVSAAIFIGFGDATDTSFTNAKMAYGAGIRIGLPPDWVSKVRIDVGYGRDQFGVFADFGQVF